MNSLNGFSKKIMNLTIRSDCITDLQDEPFTDYLPESNCYSKAKPLMYFAFFDCISKVHLLSFNFAQHHSLRVFLKQRGH